MTQEQTAVVNEILTQLDDADNSGNNGRKALRKPIRVTLLAILLTTNSHPTFIVHTRNISTSGISFISKRMFKKGETAALLMDVPGKPEKMFWCKVAFSRYVRNGYHEVGCEFMECVSDHPGPERVPMHWYPATPLMSDTAK